jgi:DMSO/TMAO reductase YedYZ heme-binding membrane subunit
VSRRELLDESGLPADRLWQPITRRWFAVLFGASLSYAVLRYHIAGDVAWEHFALFILNKAVALAAVALIAASYLIGPVIRWLNGDPRRLVVIKFCGLMGFSLAAIHAFMAVLLMRPAYFGKFFLADGRMNGTGELAMTLGVLGLWAVSLPAVVTLPMMPKAIGGVRWKRNQRMGYLCLALILGHLVVMGWRGWISPGTWPAGLPPISLWAAIGCALPLVARIRRTRPRGS